MTLLIIFCSLLLLILLITWVKVNPFLSFLIVAILTGLLLGIPVDKIASSVQKGMGDTLGGLIIIIVLGAMQGKLIAESGAAQKISSVLVKSFGTKNIQWALVATGFIVGIPLYYQVGFVLLIPLIFSVVYRYKLPIVYIGLPTMAALSVTHGFLPPHPAPVALIGQFHANMGITLLYGFIIAIPAIIIGGPLYSRTLRTINSAPLEAYQPADLAEEKLPGTFTSFFIALLPVVLLMITTALLFTPIKDELFLQSVNFLNTPAIVMLLSLIVATYYLGINQGRTIKEVMKIYEEAVKDVAMILLIIGAAGAMKQILADSGVDKVIAAQLQNLHLQPLVLGWLIAAIIRACIGSSTIAGLTAAGIIAPLVVTSGVNPNLMVLSVGAGSLAFSHVNDTGFWMFKEYYNLSLKDTFRSWSVMETIVSVVGLIGVLVLDWFV